MPDTAPPRSTAQPITMSVVEAKAKFSSLIDGVSKKHTPVTILRRGVPVAQVVPLPEVPRPMLRGSMAGSVRVLGDIVNTNWDKWTVDDWPDSDPHAK